MLEPGFALAYYDFPSRPWGRGVGSSLSCTPPYRSSEHVKAPRPRRDEAQESRSVVPPSLTPPHKAAPAHPDAITPAPLYRAVPVHAYSSLPHSPLHRNGEGPGVRSFRVAARSGSPRGGSCLPCTISQTRWTARPSWRCARHCLTSRVATTHPNVNPSAYANMRMRNYSPSVTARDRCTDRDCRAYHVTGRPAIAGNDVRGGDCDIIGGFCFCFCPF
jgi:hypothetical protein